MFRAILNANEHSESVSVGFPISKSVYADTITNLQQQSMGHVVNQDCRVEEIIRSAFLVLRRLEGERSTLTNWAILQSGWTVPPTPCGVGQPLPAEILHRPTFKSTHPVRGGTAKVNKNHCITYAQLTNIVALFLLLYSIAANEFPSFRRFMRIFSANLPGK